ncbi:helix-turn-helix domain-containing protein [Thermosynechococcaceae cyanobacterium BACA0444]|uniref:Helix-turn-helix domain-containing protein n=1 Tax=Pseudocalidococcus azoricus BACA0444 TaxID=2918990 RepID=A0AAE4JW45_9CYAN|nr:helix-turn-helix domain-containing protein [Pseudocalidococcus azoricus]MDS3860666.1 helix-turn-helix domain-containing protein [Pseudocalidococcus azoricus BACA0444]
MTVLSGPWTLYLIWVLSQQGATRFGVLRQEISGISTKMLTERLRMLEREGIIQRHYQATIPPQVSYDLTDKGAELIAILGDLYSLAERWYGESSEAAHCLN